MQTTPGTRSNQEVRGVLSAGTRLYDYEIISVLSQSGLSATYLAHDTNLDCRVAIKEYLPLSLASREGDTCVMPRSTALGEQFVQERKRFVDEACALAKLGETRGIVRIDDLFEANGTAYLVMELAKGETLRQRLWHEKHLPPHIVERMLASLLEGLEKIHAAGLLHRDIKPASIILDARGDPTLIDFVAHSPMAAAFTPDYAAPEQFTAAEQGPWTDIYGLAATLHHAITGAPPPIASDRMLGDPYQPLAARPPAGFALDLLHGIDVGLTVRSGDRPQSIAAWRGILPPLMANNGLASLVMLPPAAARLAVATRPGLAVGLGVAIVGALIVSAAALKPTASIVESADIASRPAMAERQPRTPLPPAEALSGATVAPNAVVATTASGTTDDGVLVLDPGRTATGGAEDGAPERTQQDSLVTDAARPMGDAARLAATQGPAPHEASARTFGQADTAPAQGAASGPKTEAALNLSEEDRKRVQAALTALGHEVPATGYFGPITRSMITAWQKSRGLAETGFLDQSQITALFTMEQTKLEAPRAEAALNLSEQDRKRVQAALTALGHEVPATGYFGPITRRMITAWQKTQGLETTGYLTDPELAALRLQAAAGPAKQDQARH